MERLFDRPQSSAGPLTLRARAERRRFCNLQAQAGGDRWRRWWRPWLGAAVLAANGGRAWGQETPHTAAAMLQVVPPDQRLTLAGVVMHARLEFRVVLIGLLLATVAAVVIWVLAQVRRSPFRERALAFLSTLIVTAPLLGLTVAAYDVLKIFLGLANFRPTPDVVMIAPALAEAAMAVFLGLLTASVAAALRGHLLMRYPTREALNNP